MVPKNIAKGRERTGPMRGRIGRASRADQAVKAPDAPATTTSEPSIASLTMTGNNANDSDGKLNTQIAAGAMSRRKILWPSAGIPSCTRRGFRDRRRPSGTRSNNGTTSSVAPAWSTYGRMRGQASSSRINAETTGPAPKPPYERTVETSAERCSRPFPNNSCIHAALTLNTAPLTTPSSSLPKSRKTRLPCLMLPAK